MAADTTYQPKVQRRNGGDLLAIASGGTLDIESGGALSIAGTDMTTVLANAVAGVSAGRKLARGVHTQLAASDTVVTGLATVVAVAVAFANPGPTVKQLFCSGDIGDQAGTPAAGSILIRTFKPTAVNDVTPVAATDFTDNVKIAWIAVGT